MKHFLSFILVTVLVICIFPMSCYAAENDSEKIYFDDGSYAVVDVTMADTRASGTVTGSKKYTYYDSSDVEQWRVVLNGTFTYTGSSATCTSSSCSASIKDTSWYVISKSASKSGNSATASATMGDKLAGVTVTKVPVSLKLTCDANGNLS